MSERLTQLAAFHEFGNSRADWNNLWQRSAVTQATGRAEFVSDWHECFAPSSPFQALCVRERENLIAALPFVAGLWRGMVPCGQLPSNDWGLCGDLLLDESVPGAADSLALGLAKLPWPLVCLNDALLDEPRWQLLLQSLQRAGIPHDVQPQFHIARLTFAGDWAGYRASWSKGHRKHVERNFRHLAQRGPVRCEWLQPHNTDEAVEVLARGLALERRGWKGQQGTAALDASVPHAWLCKQVRHLATLGQARFGFLCVGERDVAFEYGWHSKGVYYSFKIAFDEEFRGCGPGQLLTALLLERLFTQEDTLACDFLCPVNESLARWRPQTYRVGKILAAPRGLASRLLVGAQRHVLRPLGAWWHSRAASGDEIPSGPSA